MPYLIFNYHFQMEDFSSLWHCLKGGEKPEISVRQWASQALSKSQLTLRGWLLCHWDLSVFSGHADKAFASLKKARPPVYTHTVCIIARVLFCGLTRIPSIRIPKQFFLQTSSTFSPSLCSSHCHRRQRPADGFSAYQWFQHKIKEANTRHLNTITFS